MSPSILLVSRPTSTLSPVSATGMRRLVRRLGGRCAVIVIARGVRRTTHIDSGATFFCVNGVIRCSSAGGVFAGPNGRTARGCVAKHFKWDVRRDITRVKSGVGLRLVYRGPVQTYLLFESGNASLSFCSSIQGVGVDIGLHGLQ